jgi:hypothetical protein
VSDPTTRTAETQPTVPPPDSAIPDSLEIVGWVRTSDPDLALGLDQTVGQVKKSFREVYLANRRCCECGECFEWPPAIFAGEDGQMRRPTRRGGAPSVPGRGAPGHRGGTGGREQLRLGQDQNPPGLPDTDGGVTPTAGASPSPGVLSRTHPRGAARCSPATGRFTRLSNG